MRVLVVDDSKGIRLKLSRMLEELGHEVVGEAGSGVEAIQMAQKTTPDLVTLDIVMPEMDGLSALRKIREIAPETKVVMVTSAATLANMKSAKEAGAVGFILKPFEKEKVASAMQALGENRGG